MHLRGVRGGVKPGDQVVCVTTEDDWHYAPGEVFIVNEKGQLEAIPPRFGQIDAVYGGDYATWAIYQPQLIELEDML
jgi:hypothetical protein